MTGAAAAPDYSVAVIGLGMIGSAACRHLSSATGEKVVGIGPGEPEDWTSHKGAFASHYDEGRLTRIVDPDPIWSVLAARSIERYALLERESGVSFHYPVGSLRVSPLYRKEGDSLATAIEIGRQNGAELELLRGPESLRRQLPYFGFEADHVGLLEGGGAGYINPRAMVKAQLAVAAKQGAVLVRETVVSLVLDTADTKDTTGSLNSPVRIVTDAGTQISASRVLISADIYTKFLLKSNLIHDRQLAMRTVPESILLAEVESEEQKRLHGMPSLIWRLDGHKELYSVYACPPVKYPDGKTYIKIGGQYRQEANLLTHEEIVKWFNTEAEQVQKSDGKENFLLQVLKELMPGLDVRFVERKPCIVTYTAHAYPYIDSVDGKPHEKARIFVVTGGNGASAKSSDEIGRIAALLVENRKWSYDVEASKFRAVFEDA